MMVPGSVSAGMFGGGGEFIKSGTGKYALISAGANTVFTLHKRSGPTTYTSLGINVTAEHGGTYSYTSPPLFSADDTFLYFTNAATASYLYKINTNDTLTLLWSGTASNARFSPRKINGHQVILIGDKIYSTNGMTVLATLPASLPNALAAIGSLSISPSWTKITTYVLGATAQANDVMTIYSMDKYTFALTQLYTISTPDAINPSFLTEDALVVSTYVAGPPARIDYTIYNLVGGVLTSYGLVSTPGLPAGSYVGVKFGINSLDDPSEHAVSVFSGQNAYSGKLLPGTNVVTNITLKYTLPANHAAAGGISGDGNMISTRTVYSTTTGKFGNTYRYTGWLCKREGTAVTAVLQLATHPADSTSLISVLS